MRRVLTLSPESLTLVYLGYLGRQLSNSCLFSALGLWTGADVGARAGQPPYGGFHNEVPFLLSLIGVGACLDGNTRAPFHH